MKPRIILLTQMHERPAVSELFCMSAIRLVETNSEQFDIKIVALVSDDASDKLCLKYDIRRIHTCVKPLGRKMNEGVTRLLELYDFDYLMQMGDDDVVCSSLMEWYAPYIASRVHYFGVNSIYFLEPKTMRACIFAYRFDAAKVWGCGRMISREALKKSGSMCQVKLNREIKLYYRHFEQGKTYVIPYYQAKYMEGMKILQILDKPHFGLWDDNQKRGLDFVSDLNLILNGYEPFVVKTDYPLFTDVKTGTNIWSYDDYAHLGKAVSMEEATRHWSPKEIEYLECLK